MDKVKLLSTARERFQESMEAERHIREAAIEDIRFENGEQWTKEEEAERVGRPCLVINKTAATVKQVLGEARKNRPRIKVRPVDNQADPNTAEVFTGMIRNIENISDAETAYDYGHDCSVRGGYGFWRIITEYSDDDTFEQDIKISRVNNQFSVYLDQSAQEPDYEDAQYCFVTETLTRQEFERRYPNKENASVEVAEGEDEAGWFTSDSVRIAEYWYKEPITKTLYLLDNGMTVEEKPEPQYQMIQDPITGEEIQQDITPQVKNERKVETHKVMWCKIAGNALLEGPQEWAGKYIPIVPCLGEEVWIEGKRHLRSAIRWAKDPQRLYNWSRSTAAETIAMAPKQPWIITEEMIEGYEDQWNQAHRKPMPYLMYHPDSQGRVPQRQQASITDTGALNEAIQASDDLKATTGIYDASLGAKGNETSGIAIARRQAQGDTATFVFTDNQQRALKYTGKILVDLIPRIYDTERVVRLMGEDGKEGWAKINMVDQMSGEKQLDLSVGKYDVVADVSPGYETKRMEAADGMVQLLTSAPNYAPIIMPRIAKNLDWPESDEIAQEMQQMNQPQQPSPKDQMDIQKGQLDLQGKQLDNAKKQMEVQKEGIDVQQQNAEMTYKIATQAVSDVLRQIGLMR